MVLEPTVDKNDEQNSTNLMPCFISHVAMNYSRVDYSITHDLAVCFSRLIRKPTWSVWSFVLQLRPPLSQAFVSSKHPLHMGLPITVWGLSLITISVQGLVIECNSNLKYLFLSVMNTILWYNNNILDIYKVSFASLGINVCRHFWHKVKCLLRRNFTEVDSFPHS